MLSTGVAALPVAGVTSATALLNTVSHLSNGPSQAQSILLGAMFQPLLPPRRWACWSASSWP